jgi:hypothetical protein
LGKIEDTKSSPKKKWRLKPPATTETFCGTAKSVISMSTTLLPQTKAAELRPFRTRLQKMFLDDRNDEGNAA